MLRSVSGDPAAMVEVEKLAESIASLWRFVRRHDLGVLRVTAAGQSIQAYRHRFGPYVWQRHVPLKGKNRGKETFRKLVYPLTHNNAEALDLEKKALHGGPVHCWFLGKAPCTVYILDVQSLYPWIMRQSKFPAELMDFWDGKNLAISAFADYATEVVATVDLDTRRPIYPLRRDGITIYPIGKFQTALCGPELAGAVQAGEVVHVHECARYRLIDLFSRYVDYFWKLRRRYEKDKQPGWAQVAKIMAVALHGKFAQRDKGWNESPKVHSGRHRWGHWPDVQPDDTVLYRRSIAGHVQTSEDNGWKDHAFPAVSAFVYSNARAYMNPFFDSARRFGRLFYSAIDSLHVDQKAYEWFSNGGLIAPGIGNLQLVGVYKNVTYHGPNDYERDGQIVQSGRPAGAMVNGCGETQWIEKESAGSVIERGPDGSLYSRMLRVKRSRVFRWGKVQKSGVVLPLEV
jgi:hypothetical protein